jgi:hypothetical protein
MPFGSNNLALDDPQPDWQRPVRGRLDLDECLVDASPGFASAAPPANLGWPNGLRLEKSPLPQPNDLFSALTSSY